MDEELLRLWAQHHNREAADRLIRRHEQALFAFALRLMRSEAEAADAVQETCLRALQKAGEFQGRSSFRTWLFGIAVNVARARRFRLQRLKALFQPLENTEHAMEDDASARTRLEMLAKVDEALASLPRENRVPILLHYYQGFDYEQIAEILKCPSGTVASRLHASRKRLEEKLRRSGVELSALGSLEALRHVGTAPIPSGLQQSLRALPQKALSAPLSVPVTGKGAMWAGGLTAAALIGGAIFLHAEALDTQRLPEWMSAPPLRAPRSVQPSSASFRAETDRRPVFPARCDAPERFELRNARSSTGRPPGQSANSLPAARIRDLSLRVSGFLRDADRGLPVLCGQVALRAVWPLPEAAREAEPLMLAMSPADANGYFQVEASGLCAGVYELLATGGADATAGRESFASPRCIVLTQSEELHHDFFLLQASLEEKNSLLQVYRDGLSRALETQWAEEGFSALRLRLLDREALDPEIFAFDQKGRSVEPLVSVVQPVSGSLLVGPFVPGTFRIEVLQPGKGVAVLSAQGVVGRDIGEANVRFSPADDFVSVEVVDAFGSPAAGAMVELQAADLWSDRPFAAGVADFEGRICFDNVPSRVHVRACRPGSLGGAAPAACRVQCSHPSSGRTLRIVLE